MVLRFFVSKIQNPRGNEFKRKDSKVSWPGPILKLTKIRNNHRKFFLSRRIVYTAPKLVYRLKVR